MDCGLPDGPRRFEITKYLCQARKPAVGVLRTAVGIFRVVPVVLWLRIGVQNPNDKLCQLQKFIYARFILRLVAG